jgi:EAL domain-containing protein (putative c-di-GMP-specific phosphodiesterase class I)
VSSAEHNSADELVRHADMAMYAAKARGKARTEMNNGRMQDFATRRLDLQSELRAALRECIPTAEETGIRPEQLRLEITESMTMDDADHATAVLNRLRALGIQLSIDDFGTGFSCLSYLHRFPLQVLKIDRSFISRMETNMESRARTPR